MKIKELRNMSRNELNHKLASMQEQVRELRFKIHSKEVKNNHTLKAIRKDIAKIMTILNEPAATQRQGETGK
jgi:large subunit ribosomal protein L29